MRSRKILVWMTILAAMMSTAQAQPPAGPVRYTAARLHEVHRLVRLPGTVEARTQSPVAAEVAGFVVEMIAHEGDHVARGKPLARLRTRNLELQLEATRGELKQAQAELHRAQRDLERSQRLREQGLLPEEELDTTEAAKLASEGRIQQIEANVERIQLDIRRCTITAPFTGVVVEEFIDVGAWINVGSAVMELISMDALEVRIDVPQTYFHQLKVGAPVDVSLSSDPPFQITGEIIAVIPRARVRSRVFPIKVRVSSDSGRLAAGMLVQASLPVGEPREVILVPKDAIINQGGNKHVFTITEESTAEQIPVQAGESYGSWIAVDGIEPGTKVITRGNERIFPGQPVAGEPQEYELP